MKLLVVGSTKDGIAVSQREPFNYNRKRIRRELDLEVEQIQAESFSAIGEVCKRHEAEVVFLFPPWRESPSEAERVIKMVREDNKSRKLMFIDPFAQTSTRYFNVLPYVDRFLKRQRL